MNNKVDATLYWSVIHKNKALESEKVELINKIERLKNISKHRYIIPKDHILIDGIEHRLDISDGKFYKKSSFQEIYSNSENLWVNSGILLKKIINGLNKNK